jgi:hypothetical protein
MFEYKDRPDIYELLGSEWFKQDVNIRPENVKTEGASRKVKKQTSTETPTTS